MNTPTTHHARPTTLPTVTLATDGSCWPNPGRGGYAAILKFLDDREEIVSGHDADTTSNRMELLAVIAGLESLGEPSRVEVITDSAYLLKGATRWVKNWSRNGWKTQEGDVKNVDLWKRLLRAMDPHELTWELVRGHSGHELNERADALADEEAKKVGSPGQPSWITSKRSQKTKKAKKGRRRVRRSSKKSAKSNSSRDAERQASVREELREMDREYREVVRPRE